MKTTCCVLTALVLLFVSAVFAGQDVYNMMTVDDIAEKFKADDIANAKTLLAKCEDRSEDADKTLVCLERYEKYMKYEAVKDYTSDYMSFKRSILLKASLESHQKASSLLGKADLLAAKRAMERRDFLLERAKDLKR